MSDTPPAPPTPSPRRRTRPAQADGNGAATPETGHQPPSAAANLANAAQDPAMVAQIARLLMGDAEAGPNVVDADPETEGTLIQFVKTGWIRFPAAVVKPDELRVHRLRRPFLGELAELRTAYEAAGDEIDLAKLDYLDAEAEHETAVKAAAQLEEPERSRANLQANINRRKARREMEGRHLAIRIEWWARVFRTLCVDWPAGTMLQPATDDEGKPVGPPVPPGWEWGAWVEDPSLPVLVINHWRSVPLDRG